MSSFFLVSCSQTQEAKPVVTETKKPQIVDIEPVKGRLNVYQSMARAAKYNVMAANKTLYDRVMTETVGKNAQDILKSLHDARNVELSPLLESVKKINFAVVYAATHLTDSNDYAQTYIYDTTAQQLALAAIKAHQDTLFALKKIKQLEKRISSLQKVQKNLDAKLERAGSLSPEDLEYKKSVEVAILKLEQLKSFLATSVTDYASLVKVEDKDLHLQGKNFYELQDFDAKNQLSTFQNAALSNRSEFDFARKEIYGFNAYDAKREALNLYPETKRLSVNGMDEKDKLYIESLNSRANMIAQALVADVNAFMKEENSEQKKVYLKNAFTQLTAAIMMQQELDYNMVKAADEDYAIAESDCDALRREVYQAEKAKSNKTADKIALMQKRLKLDEQELRLNQISGERALALRSLYFHTGLSPLSKQLLNEKISKIEGRLKQAFNQDMIEMLARADEQEKQEKKTGNTWAKKDNWLEILIDQGGEKKETPITLPDKPKGEFDPYVGAEYDAMTVMQLGAYRQRQSADIEWQMLKEIYPEFAEISPKVESSMQNGKMLYRLVIKSANGNLRELCNKLRADKVECILRKK